MILKKPIYRFCFIISFALIVQLIGRYYSQYFLIFKYFDSLKFLIVFIAPLLAGFFILRLKPVELGLGVPVIPSKKFIGLLLIALVAIGLLIFTITFNSEFLNNYAVYRIDSVSWTLKLERFSIFTASTLIGWEFLHRGFLLFGLRAILIENKINAELAALTSILWVMCFETVYHFIKPDMEAMGILALSPFLSWIAFKTKSLWLSFMIHLYIEILFILILINTNN